MIYTVTNIEYDSDGVDDLPETLEIEVDDSLEGYEKVEFISDEISNITSFCHKGFSTIPEIKE